MGLQATDAVSLAEFISAYSFIFDDDEVDGSQSAGAYRDKVWRDAPRPVSVPRRLDGMLPTIAYLASEEARSGMWQGTDDECASLLRKLAVGRTSEQIRALQGFFSAWSKCEKVMGDIPSSGSSSCFALLAMIPKS